eukprot:Skav224771  [mRNA]  locus=scaffold1604:638490:639377:- [translate_table: standard]
MRCDICGVFAGSPTCPSCRAVSRIGSLLRSGLLKVQQEDRVVTVLRGAAGELSDLAESSQPPKSPERPPRGKEETKGLPSGPGIAPKPSGAGTEESEEYYSYSEGEVEAEDAKADSKKVAPSSSEKKPTPPKGPPPKRPAEEKEPARRDKPRGREAEEAAKRRAGPGRLGAPLGLTPLTPTAKASSRDQPARKFVKSGDRTGEAPVAAPKEEARKDEPREREGEKYEEVKVEEEPGAPGARERSHSTEDRSPIERRRHKKKRARGTKGRKRRTRGRDYQPHRRAERRGHQQWRQR